MKPTKPLVAGLVAALLFAIYLYDRGAIRERRLQDVVAARLIPFDFAEAEFVRVQNANGEFEVEKRANGEWWIVKPVELRADWVQVKTLIDNLHASKKANTFEPDSLEEYGLDKPSPVVTVRGLLDGSTVERTLMLGHDTARIGRLYGKLGHEKEIFTVGDWIRNQSMVELSHLRDKSLMHFETGEIVALQLTQGGETIRIASRGDRGWWVETWDRPGRQDFISRTLVALSSANAARVIDDPTTPTAQLGLDSPLLTLEVQALGGTQRLEIGQKVPGADQFYVRSTVQPGLAVARAGFVSSLLVPLAEWGTRQFCWIPPDEITRVETQSGTARMTLVRDANGEWIFEDYPGIEIHERRLQLAMEAWTTVAADRFVSAARTPEEEEREYGIREESFQLRLYDDDGQVHGMHRGRLDTIDQTAFVKRLQDGTIWKVDARQFGFVQAFRADLQDKRIEHGYADQVALIHYRDLVEDAEQTLERGQAAWRLRVPGAPSFLINPLHVQNLIEAIEELEWESISVTEEALEPMVRIELRAADGTVLFWFEQVRSDPESVTLNTPNGVFDVRPEAYNSVFQRWVEMLGARQLEMSR